MSTPDVRQADLGEEPGDVARQLREAGWLCIDPDRLTDADLHLLRCTGGITLSEESHEQT